MSQYSSHEGHPTDWHLVHLGSRAVGGAGLIMIKAKTVRPKGRITPHNSRIWANERVAGSKRITAFLKLYTPYQGFNLRMQAVRSVWPKGLLLIVRTSASD